MPKRNCQCLNWRCLHPWNSPKYWLHILEIRPSEKHVPYSFHNKIIWPIPVRALLHKTDRSALRHLVLAPARMCFVGPLSHLQSMGRTSWPKQIFQRPLATSFQNSWPVASHTHIWGAGGPWPSQSQSKHQSWRIPANHCTLKLTNCSVPRRAHRQD